MGNESIKAYDLLALINDILGEEYTRTFREEGHADHYEVTPYSYEQEQSYCYTSDKYIDLGAGLLELIKKMNI
jgi:hypothetical protein